MRPPNPDETIDWVALDCLLTFGERRPHWSRPPTIREMAAMKALRAKWAKGALLMCSPFAVPQVATKAEPTTTHRHLPQIRPAGMPDDHPAILSGRYL